jgi:hypothetical protein
VSRPDPKKESDRDFSAYFDGDRRTQARGGFEDCRRRGLVA